MCSELSRYEDAPFTKVWSADRRTRVLVNGYSLEDVVERSVYKLRVDDSRHIRRFYVKFPIYCYGCKHLQMEFSIDSSIDLC